MPFGFGGGPWWIYNSNDLRRYWGRCFRFPWLPRWWWAWYNYGTDFSDPEEEKKILKEELKNLEDEIRMIKERLKELEAKKAKK